MNPSLTDLSVVRPHATLPGYYSSLISTDSKLAITRDVCEQIATAGYTPQLATITGSRLRGLDHPASDTDVLVFVAESCDGPHGRKRLQHVVDTIKTSTVEAQIRPSAEIRQTCSTSLPYMEALFSPFLLGDALMTQWVRTYRPNLLEFAAHAQRFALHIANRSTHTTSVQTLDKRLRNIIAARQFTDTLNPLADRSLFVPGSDTARAAATWLLGSLDSSTTEHDPAAVHRVADALTGR